MDSTQSRSDSFFGFVKTLAELSLLFGAGFFVIGWSYLYGYYRAFGLSTDELNFSVDSVLVHSIPVITRAAFWVPVLVVIVAVAIGHYSPRSARLLGQPWLVLPLLLIAGHAASRFASGVGRDNAWRDAYVSTSTLPYVMLEGAEGVGATGCSLAESNYRLLTRANGQVFVVLPVDKVEEMAAPNMRVCSFPESRIKALRIQIGLVER